MIATISKAIKDPEFKIELKPDWSSAHSNYRQEIRKFLSAHFTKYFTRAQLATIHDLEHIPKSEIGCFSISHCQKLGGFSYSEFSHGFDVEEISRISDPILRRTTKPEEYEQAPKKYYLWAAKEAAYKALARDNSETNLNVTDLICVDWQPQFGLDVWGFQIQSDKQVSLEKNQGFVFEEKGLLFSIFFN